jgi:hypothetical protein
MFILPTAEGPKLVNTEHKDGCPQAFFCPKRTANKGAQAPPRIIRKTDQSGSEPAKTLTHALAAVAFPSPDPDWPPADL